MEGTPFGILITTIGTVVVAYIGYLGTRDKKTRRIAEGAERSIDGLETKVSELRRKLDAAMDYIFDLRGLMRETGYDPPDLPNALDRRK